MEKEKTSSVDAYIAPFPPAAQALLNSLRQAIRKAAPGAEEGISYGMPAYKLHGPLVYFGGFKDHASLFPTGSAIRHFAAELDSYTTSKGTVQFPYGERLPLKLVERIVRFRVLENEAKAAAKKKKPQSKV